MTMDAKQTPMRVDAGTVNDPLRRPRWQAGFARGVLLGVLLLGLLLFASNIYVVLGQLATLALLLLYLLAGALVFFRGSHDLRVATCLLVLAAAGMTAILSSGAPGNGTFFFLGLVTIAAMLWSPTAGAVSTAVSLILIGTSAALMGAPAGAASPSVASWIGAALAVLLFGVAFTIGLRHMHSQVSGEMTTAPHTGLQDPERTAESRPRDETSAFLKALEIGRTVSVIHDPSKLTAEAAKQIAEQFAVGGVAIFLVTERSDLAVRSAAAGVHGVAPAEEASLERPLAGDSAVAGAIRARRHWRSIETGGPMAFPLMRGDTVLGALELWPGENRALEDIEIQALQALADHVAIALDNARSLSEAHGQPQEVQRSEQAGVTWRPAFETGVLNYQIGEPEGAPGGSKFEVPLSLRDEQIGTISLAADADWSADQKDLVEAVASQAALALENARLLEASQMSAVREHTLAEITGRIWASPTIEGILRTALQELGQTFGVERATVELRMERGDGS